MLVLGLPDERLESLLIDAAAERRARAALPGPAGARLARGRPSDVLSSKPAISISPVEKGRWNTVPAGCTVIDVTSGRTLRGR